MALIFPAPAQIKNLQDPTAAQDAATKFYVDTALGSGSSIGAAGSNTQIQFNNNNSLSASANLTFDSATTLLTVTGNIAASNANLGNLVTANFFSGNGSLLTGITAVTASTAQTITENAQPNITSTGTLVNLIVSGNVSFTGANISLGNVSNLHITGGASAQVLSTDGTGNLSWVAQTSLSGYATETYVGTAITNLISSAPAVLDTLGELSNALGNDASFSTTITNTLANKLNTNAFSTTANTWLDTKTTSNLTEGTNLYYTDTRANSSIDARVTKTFVDNLSIVANIANSANSVSGSNVIGQVANALVASTVYTNAQPNITSVGTLSNIIISGNVNLSDVSNVHILGGTAGYYLKTDGTGNLSWSEVATSSVSSIIVDTFTANGVQTSFTLSTAPANANVTTINYNGATLLRESYSISGSDVVFTSAPANGAKLEITTIAPIIGGYSNAQVASYLPTYSGNLTFANASVTGNIIPTANVTYDLGSPTKRWKDLYLSSTTLHLGDTSISAADILPIDLDILPEVLVIQVAAPDPGDDTTWLWTWQQSTLPFARTTITNSPQLSVPLYRQGTYQINNFANEQTGSMTQTHRAKLKWIDGAGSDNVVSWAVDAGNIVMSHPSINNGANTTVQRFNVNVPSVVTLPTLVAPNVSYDVSFANVGAYTIGGSAMGDNKNLGPMYRGGTYTFNLDSSITNHPFYLTTDNGTNFVANTYFGEYTNGVTGSRNNGTTGKTTLTLVVDATTPSTLYYQCGVHSMMRGAITIKDLAVETNVNGNPILYFQHSHEGHKTPVEIRPLPSLVNQMCVVYDASTGKFVPQDLATYVENTPSFKNKIQEVAGTATLVAADGVAVVPTVSIVEDATYLPLIGNKDGDITYAQDTETLYIWNSNNWTSTKTTTLAGSAITGTVSNATTAVSANSIAGANVTGQVSNALISGTVYTNAQPNITSVGTLTSLTVDGNTIVTGNLTVTGTTYTISSNNIAYTDSIVELHTQANLAPLTTDDGKDIGIRAHYYKSADKHAFFGIDNTNLTFEYIVDGTETSGVFAGTYGDFKGSTFISTVTNGTAPLTVSSTTKVANLNADLLDGYTATTVNTANTIVVRDANGNVSANYFTGNGASLISITGANVTGTVENATYSVTAGAANSVAGANVTGQVSNALVSSTVYTNAQPNITSVGTLTGLAVNGTANLSAVGNVKITGGTSGQVLRTDGAGNLSFVTVTTTTPDPMHPFLLGL